MKLVLGSLLLAGVCWLGATKNFPTMQNFNYRRIAGTWYPLASIVIELQFPQYTIKAEPKRTISYSFKYRVNDRCKAKKLKFTEQKERGKFKTLRPILVQILDTDYRTYCISYVQRGMNSFLTLAGKENNLTEDLKMKLRDYATSVGVTGDIIELTQRDSC